MVSHVPLLQNSVVALQVLLHPPQLLISLAKLCMCKASSREGK
jgi:hypothetical protein